MNTKRLIILILVAAVVFEYRFIFSPSRKRIISLNKLIEKKKEDYKLLKKMCQEYEKLKKGGKSSSVKIADKKFSLFSYVGDVIEKKNLKQFVRGIKPLPPEEKDSYKIEKIKLTFENITLDKLVDFLIDVEKKNFYVYIPEFSMRKNKEKPYLLSVEMEMFIIKNG
ncbi:hypothetical protein J7L87_03670 [bacterium]|nr:hypothetical protein [bacterium]